MEVVVVDVEVVVRWVVVVALALDSVAVEVVARWVRWEMLPACLVEAAAPVKMPAAQHLVEVVEVAVVVLKAVDLVAVAVVVAAVPTALVPVAATLQAVAWAAAVEAVELVAIAVDVRVVEATAWVVAVVAAVAVVVADAILADACHVVGLVVSRVGQLVASPVAVLQVAPTLAAAVGTAVVGVKRPCVVEHPALEHHVDAGISPAAAVVLGGLKAALRPMWRQLGLKLKILVETVVAAPSTRNKCH